MIDIEKIVAIDVHTHAEVSCRQPHDDYRPEFDEAFARYFKSGHRPTIPETVAYYREQHMAFIMFTIDSEHETGKRRIPNEEVAEAALEHPDVMIAFASIDPHKGRMGAREARRLIEDYGVRGFKFHPTVQGFYPNDRMGKDKRANDVNTNQMNTIGRRDFLSRLSLATAAVSLPQYAFSSVGKADEFVEVAITHGRVRGMRKDGVNLFKGIPYGGRISGDRHFRRPAPLQPWTGVRDALQFGAPAIQSPRRNEPAPSGDCLFLNVWTPANDDNKRPVMFYSHGGGFVGGSGAAAGQDGSNLARNFNGGWGPDDFVETQL